MHFLILMKGDRFFSWNLDRESPVATLGFTTSAWPTRSLFVSRAP